ncbi:MAG: hypothetical protein ABI359_10470 [Ginsengibacter sp.]
MSLNNIQLSGETCKNLFQSNLIQLTNTDSQEKPVSTKTDSLGENLQKIFFLVNDPSCRFLADDEMEMVTKLLSACKLSMADIALVNFHFNPMDYQSISKMFEPKKILLFGVSSTQLDLPFSIPFFQVQSFHEQLYMTAPPLRDLLNNKELKKELWISLQKLFL